MTKRSKSSKRWVAQHERDEFVRRAQHEGWRSRAVYKLAEIQDRYHIIRRGTVCVDLGAAPGAWSQFAVGIVGERGRVIACDLLPMDPLPGVEFVRGDFTESQVLAEIVELLGGPADLVMSDMAPNITGLAAIDQPKAIHLAELTADFARQVLNPRGALLVKVFQGEGFDAFVKSVRRDFEQVRIVKPRASRARSRETYLLARHRRM